MPSKNKALTGAELEAYESQRDIGAEILQGLLDMKAGRTTVVYSPAIAARQKSGLSQAGFAKAIGVSVRTLQGWEQGRRKPTGAAKALIQVAERAPEALRIAGLLPAVQPSAGTTVESMGTRTRKSANARPRVRTGATRLTTDA